MFERPIRVPVMTFHSVGDVLLPHDLRELTTTPTLLDRILAWLTRHSFKTLSLQELFDHLEFEAQVPSKSLVLTFDDGYLDNWVFVHPLLKRHGHRGVIFVSGDFVQEGDEPRPTLEDVWEGKLDREDLESLGYCSWTELRAMADSGTMEVQSHLMTHTWYPVSSKIIGFHRPQKPWYVGLWNEAPSLKPYWLGLSKEEISEVVPWGLPIYEHARSHVSPRCWPDEELNRLLIDHVANHGEEQFFERTDCERVLRDLAKRNEPIALQCEEDEGFLQRVRDECVETRRLIEEHLPGHRANFMAWPGGDRETRTLEIALETYDATITADPGVTTTGQSTAAINRRFFAQSSRDLMGSDLPSFIHFIGRLQRLRGYPSYAIHTFLSRKIIEIGSMLSGDSG